MIANSVITTDNDGNEILSSSLPDAVMQNIASNSTILNAVSQAGKYVQTVELGEDLVNLSKNPTPMTINGIPGATVSDISMFSSTGISTA